MKSFKAGLFLLILICVMTLCAPLFLKEDPGRHHPQRRLEGPSLEHLMGTDHFGRDIWTRIWHGGRVTLSAALLTLSSTILLGTAVGVTAGYLGGWVDTIIIRITDTLLAFPSLVISLVMAAYYGPGLKVIIPVLVFTWWVAYARLARGITLQAREELSVIAARVAGAPRSRIILFEIVPTVLGPVLSLASLDLGYIIITLSGLSFLGLGAQAPVPEWGAMLADGRAYFISAPHLMFFPGFMIFVTVAALNLVGEYVQSLIDPYQVSGKESSR